MWTIINMEIAPQTQDKNIHYLCFMKLLVAIHVLVRHHCQPDTPTMTATGEGFP